MRIDRRAFLQLAGAAVMSEIPPIVAAKPAERRFKAVAFDAFPIFDPRPVAALAEQIFPGRGSELSNLWRTRQFEYQWLHSLSGHYADFWRATEDALVFSARSLRLELTTNARARLMQAYLELKAWPDTLAAVESLRQSGVRLALLSNMTTPMLEQSIRNSALEGVFAHVLSTDRIASYKPHPRAYQLAIDAFKLEREEILFAAFAGWDVAGAKWFGYPTFWVNRANAPVEELGVAADAQGRDLADLVNFVKGADLKGCSEVQSAVNRRASDETCVVVA